MAEDSSENPALKIAKLFLSLIQQRSSEVATEEAKTEAIYLTHWVLEFSRRADASAKISKELFDTDPYKELEALNKVVNQALDKIEALSPAASLELLLSDLNNEHETLSPQERLTIRLAEASDILDKTMAMLKPRGKGRPHQPTSKEEYFEAIIQIFEKASGLQYEDLSNLAHNHEQSLKNILNKLLYESVPQVYSMTENEAIYRAARKYIKEGRKYGDDVKEALKESLYSHGK